jgi:hypothetical protein
MRHGVHVVNHVVELFGERVDVLAIERRDERGVQPAEDRARDDIAFVLAGSDLGVLAGDIGRVDEHLAQPLGAL